MKKELIILSAIFLTVAVTSCTTIKEVPEGLSSAQLIQQGQNAYGISDFKAAQMYYAAVIERFGEDTATYVEAKYELGHLFLKTKDYKKAYAAFSEILEIYDSTANGSLPASYRKLAQIGIDKIPENKQK